MYDLMWIKSLAEKTMQKENMYDFMWIKSLRWIEKCPEKRWEYYVWKESMRICWNVYGQITMQKEHIYDLMWIKSLGWIEKWPEKR